MATQAISIPRPRQDVPFMSERTNCPLFIDDPFMGERTNCSPLTNPFMEEWIDCSLLSHEEIRPYVSKNLYQILCKNFTQEEISQLFCAGVQRKFMDHVINIQAKWLQTKDQIKELVFCLTDDQNFVAWIPPSSYHNRSPNYLSITNNFTKIESKQHDYIPSFFLTAMHGKRTTDPAPQLEVTCPQNPRGIAIFFDHEYSCLPESIRDSVSDKVNERVLSLLNRREI